MPDESKKIPRKPYAVWALQIAAVLAAATWTGLFIWNAGHSLASSQTTLSDHALGACVHLALLALSLAAVVQVQRRRSSGRILGLVWLTLLWVTTLPQTLLFALEEVREAPNGNFAAGSIIATGILLAIATSWTYFFGFSRAARMYFPSTGAGQAK